MSKGRIFSILFGPILCFSLVALSSNISRAKDDAKGPRMQFEETQHDFGAVNQGVQLSHPFKFKNIGTDTLRIEKVKTSCGCTAAWESSKNIAPEAEGQIEVRFDTGGRSGKFLKTIYVYSNDAKSAKQRLMIQGMIETEKSPSESDSEEPNQ